MSTGCHACDQSGGDARFGERFGRRSGWRVAHETSTAGGDVIPVGAAYWRVATVDRFGGGVAGSDRTIGTSATRVERWNRAQVVACPQRGGRPARRCVALADAVQRSRGAVRTTVARSRPASELLDHAGHLQRHGIGPSAPGCWFPRSQLRPDPCRLHQRQDIEAASHLTRRAANQPAGDTTATAAGSRASMSRSSRAYSPARMTPGCRPPATPNGA